VEFVLIAGAHLLHEKLGRIYVWRYYYFWATYLDSSPLFVRVSLLLGHRLTAAYRVSG